MIQGAAGQRDRGRVGQHSEDPGWDIGMWSTAVSPEASSYVDRLSPVPTSNQDHHDEKTSVLPAAHKVRLRGSVISASVGAYQRSSSENRRNLRHTKHSLTRTALTRRVWRLSRA